MTCEWPTGQGLCGELAEWVWIAFPPRKLDYRYCPWHAIEIQRTFPWALLRPLPSAFPG